MTLIGTSCHSAIGVLEGVWYINRMISLTNASGDMRAMILMSALESGDVVWTRAILMQLQSCVASYWSVRLFHVQPCSQTIGPVLVCLCDSVCQLVKRLGNPFF